jgi:hypothetical protein
MRRSRVFALMALALVTGAACSALLDLQPPPVPEDGGTTDATTPVDGGGSMDGSGTDGVAADAAPDVVICLGLDASPPNGEGDASTTWYPFKDMPVGDAGASTWEFFEPSSVNTFSRNFQGGAFDGRYVYFVPSQYGTVTRYDTLGSFQSNASWSTFDTSTLSLGAQGFSGAVYDGQYVYFVPYHSPLGYEGLVVRYDTHGSFDAGAPAWTSYDISTIPDSGSPLTGFSGGTFDGNAVYLAPYFNGVERVSRVPRYAIDGGTTTVDAGDAGAHDGGDAGETDAGKAGAAEAGPPQFGTAAQWSWFDMSVPNNNAAGYYGAVFDGQYVYLVPYINNAGSSGVVARYDTSSTFTTGSAWSFFDTSTVNTGSLSFVGGAFDGRYVYLVPHSKTIVTRFDTTGDFVHSSSWSTFDVSQIVPIDGGTAAFAGAAFDGRFVYLVPELAAGQSFGIVTRYDSWSTFESPCAWSAYDISQLNASAIEYFGAVYDGQYLYLVPKGTVVARFNTKSSVGMPPLPAFNGSFLCYQHGHLDAS